MKYEISYFSIQYKVEEAAVALSSEGELSGQEVAVRALVVGLPVGAHALSAVAYHHRGGKPGLATTAFLRVVENGLAHLAGREFGKAAASDKVPLDDLSALRSSLRAFVGEFEEMGVTFDTAAKNQALEYFARALPPVSPRGGALSHFVCHISPRPTLVELVCEAPN